MMRSKITPLVFLLLCFTAYAFAENKAVVDQPDLYWLSYIENGCCVHLTQIDSVGTVVKAPIKIEGGPTISLNGTSAINIWKSRSRDVLDEKTLTVVKTAKTGWAQPILVTQKADHNFAVLNRKQKLSLKFIPVSGSGKRTGKSHTVSFVGDNSLCYDGEFTYCAPGLVSADGKLLFWSILDLFERGGIYFQLLDNAGRPNVAQKNVNFFLNGSTQWRLATFCRKELLTSSSSITPLLPARYFIYRLSIQYWHRRRAARFFLQKSAISTRLQLIHSLDSCCTRIKISTNHPPLFSRRWMLPDIRVENPGCL